MQFLETKNEIKAALAVMNPVAREAAQYLAEYLMENPHLLQDEEEVKKLWLGSCFYHLQQAGYDLEDQQKTESFFEHHGASVLNVGMSIVIFAFTHEAGRRKKRRWIGRAAVFAAGAILGGSIGG